MSLIICASVLVHGISAAPFMRWYVRVAGPPQDKEEEPDKAASNHEQNEGQPSQGVPLTAR